jgi:EF hand
VLDRSDANKDGQLTADEIKQSAASQAPPSDEGAGGRGRGGRGGRGGPFGGDPLMTALDGNADGALDAVEIAASPKALRTLDRDGDGVLAVLETVGRFGGPGGGRGLRGGRE